MRRFPTFSYNQDLPNLFFCFQLQLFYLFELAFDITFIFQVDFTCCFIPRKFSLPDQFVDLRNWVPVCGSARRSLYLISEVYCPFLPEVSVPVVFRRSLHVLFCQFLSEWLLLFEELPDKFLHRSDLPDTLSCEDGDRHYPVSEAGDILHGLVIIRYGLRFFFVTKDHRSVRQYKPQSDPSCYLHLLFPLRIDSGNQPQLLHPELPVKLSAAEQTFNFLKLPVFDKARLMQSHLQLYRHFTIFACSRPGTE